MNNITHKIPKSRSVLLAVFFVLFFTVVGFGAGWFAHLKTNSCKVADNSIKTLRLSSHEFTSPLLTCDTEVELKSPKMDSLAKNIANFVQTEINKGEIDAASVYVRDYSNDDSLNVNPDEKYYPASLNKIPVMIATYKTEIDKPGFLSQTHLNEDSTDYNYTVEVQPKDSLKAGQTYSVDEAVSKMIRNSDNNALFFLGKYIEPGLYQQTFKDLKVPLTTNTAAREDYMTAKDFSYFLRVLYNSTYLGQEYSEKALKLLSETDFNDGLAAGLPANTKIAHKFGIDTMNKQDGSQTRELHDCGIVYKDKPYLICVMTKDHSSLESAQKAIQNISSIVYQELRG